MDRQIYENAAKLLPSCDDLLNGVQPRSETHRDPYLSWTTRRNPPPHHDGQSTNRHRSSFTTYFNMANESSRHEIEYIPRRSSQTSISSSSYQGAAINTPISSTFSQAMPHADLAFRTAESLDYHPSMYTRHPHSPSAQTPPYVTYSDSSPISYPNSYTTSMRNSTQMPSYVANGLLWSPDGTRDRIPSQSTKAAATNARHKNSEKKRRDVTVSCNASNEIFIRDFHPGVAVGCKVCIEGEKARKLLPAFDGLYNVDKSKDADGLLNRMKRPKNDKLEEECTKNYLYVLHHFRESYRERVQELSELMKEQKKEQERGIREAGNSEAKLRKWQGDQRAAQTEKLLRQARELGQRHGLFMDEDCSSAQKKQKKRKCDEEHQWQQKRHTSAPTPPSSVGSPRSREGTSDTSDE